MTDLAELDCESIDSDTSQAKMEDIENYLQEIEGWELNKGDPPKIQKEFIFENFKEAIEFVNKVADIAQEQWHHPDISIYGFNKALIEFTSHEIGGLHKNDFIMAAKVNKIEF